MILQMQKNISKEEKDMEFYTTRLILTLLLGEAAAKKVLNNLMLVALPFLVFILTYGVVTIILENPKSTPLTPASSYVNME